MPNPLPEQPDVAPVDAPEVADARAVSDAGGAAGSPVSCAQCGTSAASRPLTWTASTGPRGTTLTCAQCTRTHLRAMEAKLEEQYW